MKKRKKMLFIKKDQIEPTYFPDGYGVRTTQNKEVVIIDFIQSNNNGEKAIISSIALPKSGALDLIKKIQSLFKEDEK
jgi:hypothetical protein